MELKDRIREALLTRFSNKNGDVNHSHTAEALNVSRQAVKAWLDGESDGLSAKNVCNISLLTGYSERWIIFGEGPKLVSSDRIEDVSALYVSDAPALRAIREYPADVQAMLARIGSEIMGRDKEKPEIAPQKPSRVRGNRVTDSSSGKAKEAENRGSKSTGRR